jgi:hypothetical protein
MSHDGVTFRQLSDAIKDANGNSWDFADPSIFYHDGEWFISFTGYVTGSYDFLVARSRNLTEWTVTQCKLGATPIHQANGAAPGWSTTFPAGPMVWAPKLFKDASDNIYLSCSIQTQADQTSVSGNGYFFRPFIAACTDIDALTFSVPVEMQLDGLRGPANAAAATANRIDQSIIQRPNGTWAMAIKDEYNKRVDVATCATLAGNWATTATNIAPLGTSGGAQFYEGPSLTPFWRNGALLYRVYVDKYFDNKQYFVETSDFVTFTSPAAIQCDCVIRHGRVVNLGYMARAETDAAVKSVERAQMFLAAPPRSGVKGYKRLNDVAGFPTIASFVPDNGVLYRYIYDAGNLEATIAALPAVGDAAEGAYFYLAVYASNVFTTGTPARVRLLSGCANLSPNGRDLTIGQHLCNADTLLKFVMTEGLWRMESIAPTDQINGLAGGLTTLASQAGSPTIANWWPQVGRAYYTDGTTPTQTISSIQTTGYPDGAEFYLCVFASSGTPGTIVLSAGAHARWGATTLSPSAAINGRLIPVRKIAGQWQLLGTV